MQTWVYLTLPEVKHAQEPVNQFYHHWGKKRNILSYSFLCPFVPPENSPESWDHPKHFSVLAESGTQLSLQSAPFMSFPHWQKIQEFISLCTRHGKELGSKNISDCTMRSTP